MNKNTIIGVIAVIIILIVGGYFFFSGENPEPTEIIQEEIKIIESASDLALQLSDLPDGWEIKSRGERTKSDVSQEALELGWEEGYNIFLRNIENPDIQIIQDISIYPLESMPKVLDGTKQTLQLFGEGINGIKKEFAFEGYRIKYRIEELNNWNIGDESIVIKKIYLDGDYENVYQIEFVKDKYYINIRGHDSGLVKGLAKEIEAKI